MKMPTEGAKRRSRGAWRGLLFWAHFFWRVDFLSANFYERTSFLARRFLCGLYFRKFSIWLKTRDNPQIQASGFSQKSSMAGGSEAVNSQTFEAETTDYNCNSNNNNASHVNCRAPGELNNVEQVANIIISLILHRVSSLCSFWSVFKIHKSSSFTYKQNAARVYHFRKHQ